MKRSATIFIILLMIMQNLVAGQQLSVPLGHRVYDVLDSAQIRGILPQNAAVRPYSTSKILDQLEALLKSNNLTQSERIEVKTLMNSLSVSYETPKNFNDMLSKGSYRSSWEEVGIKAAVGINGEIELTHSLVERGVYDSRNVGRAYVSADILDFASVYMDFGFRMDHLDPSLVLSNDYSIPTEGKYDTLFDHSSQHAFYYGLDLRPEVSVSLLDNNVQLRWASIQRDWGVGTNNLMISASARSFEGIELAIHFTPWLRYNFITGSLGKFIPDRIDDDSEALTYYFDNYHFSDGSLRQSLYDNNFSAHRVEVSFPYNLTFGIYESIIYGKRFELAYLNPFNIIMFQQNILGDFDNMLAGVDLEWRLPGILRAYGALATTEMNEISPSKFFSSPRNIMGMQGGVDLDIPAGTFSKLTLQYTYLNAFFYTHYPLVETTSPIEGEFSRERISELMYVNKGENLGYPLRPNSDEILVRYTMGLPKGISTDITAKYQRRSGQYGFNMDEFMVYKAHGEGHYPEKDFSGNIFEKTFGLDLSVSKTLSDFPMTVYGKYIYTAQSRREPQLVKVWDYTSSEKGELGDINGEYDLNSDNYHGILYSVTGQPWTGWDHSHAIQIGVSIWH